MPYSLNYAPIPLPPRRPDIFGVGQEDLNALAQLIEGPTREEKIRALMQQFHASPYGQPRPYSVFVGGNMNAMRDMLYPYLQMMGLAVGEQKRPPGAQEKPEGRDTIGRKR